MIALPEKKGLLIFLGLLALVIVVSLAAYQMTGQMDIKERFSHAVGLEHAEDAGKEGSGWFGLSLEGSPLLYGVTLGILAIGCYAAYLHFSV
ncbi:MAG: hypothetical protein NTV10_08565 [Methanoregula sp.]|nr:hypothetical protein [Methanoregula sp.]